MSQRFERLATLFRRLLLGSFYAAGVLYFWLPCHEVFEGPKVMASLIYCLFLAVASLPLLRRRWPSLWQARPRLLQAGAILLGATCLSLLGAYAALPGNLLLSVEHIAPVVASALAALVFWLESAEQRRKVLYFWLCAHSILLFYGLIQVLDQNWASAHGKIVDLIRWTQFGQSRVYSTMGNPDYMAAHLTLVLPLWAGLGWRRIDPRGPAQVAALTLLILPFVLLPAVYGFGPIFDQFMAPRVIGHWITVCVALFIAARYSSAKTCWLGLLGLLTFLVILAQGRGAYLGLVFSLAVVLGAAYWLGGKAWFQARWQTLKWAVYAVAATGALLLFLLLGRAASPQSPTYQVGATASALKVVDSLWDRVIHVGNSLGGAQVVRKFYWQAAWRMGLQHPLFGVGFGNHALFTARAQSGVWKQMELDHDPRVELVEPHVELYTHNDLLQNWAETGLLGLLAFLFFWWVFAREAWAQAQRTQGQRQDLALGLLGLAVALLINAQVNFPWRVLATQQLCWFALAILALGPALLVDGQEPEPKEDPMPSGPWLMALGVALVLGLYPTRWFFASSLFKQGNIYKDRQDVKSIPYYEKAVKAGLSGTQEVELYLYLGSMYNVAQRPDLAEEAFKKGLAAYPDFLEALYNLGYTYQTRYAQTQAPADLATAKGYYEHLLEVNPRHLSGLNNLGNIYYAERDFPKAAELYLRLGRFGPTMVEGYYNLGATYIMMSDAPKALAAFEAALKVKPDYAPALQYAQQLRRLPKGAQIAPGVPGKP
jgi:tetratricopeptide (TPR) repeat protein